MRSYEEVMEIFSKQAMERASEKVKLNLAENLEKGIVK